MICEGSIHRHYYTMYMSGVLSDDMLNINVTKEDSEIPAEKKTHKTSSHFSLECSEFRRFLFKRKHTG